jgi:hypothetical protein
VALVSASWMIRYAAVSSSDVSRRLAALLVDQLDRAVDLRPVVARAFAQRFDRRSETEVIQRDRAQVGDQRAKV